MLNGSCTPKSCRDIANNDTAGLPSRSGSELWPKGMSSWRQGELSSMRLVEAQRVVRKGNMSGRIRKYHSIYVVLFHVYIYNYNIHIYIFISRLVDQNHGLIPCKSQPAASSSSWPILCIWQFLANAEPVSSPWMPHYAHHEGSSIYISSPIHSASQDNPGLIRRIHLPGRQSFVCSPSQQPSGLRTRG